MQTSKRAKYRSQYAAAQFLADRKTQFNELVSRVLAGEQAALLEFKDTYAPKAIANRWIVEDGESPNSPELQRWNSAIKDTPIYRETIKRVLGRESPIGWSEWRDDDNDWNDVLGSIDDSRQRA